jgi:hypothetical protein
LSYCQKLVRLGRTHPGIAQMHETEMEKLREHRR